MKTDDEKDASFEKSLTREEEIDKMQQLAKQMDVSFYEDRKLIDELFDLDFEERIPGSFASILSELINVVNKDEVQS